MQKEFFTSYVEASVSRIAVTMGNPAALQVIYIYIYIYIVQWVNCHIDYEERKITLTSRFIRYIY